MLKNLKADKMSGKINNKDLTKTSVYDIQESKKRYHIYTDFYLYYTDNSKLYVSI